ncbi:Gfo/Idh/MocA family oxidoreductase [Tateyamaria omphalii]|uniref:Gfo/Idh/MocA family protein n=1 Tax=Tateyamaria omphalii TaxID=299262 RepID=UPI001C99DC50|nr:Gfo/Idh/MocA family oxidoreductase [Tateyamaria omphalii]MBY5933707.1 Gfo/Idh/MocA family oxidoreductase [Tateyamaria omphalii]
MTRIGVAGVGLIGRQHLDAIARARGVTVSAVFDPALTEDVPWPVAKSLSDLAAQSDGVILAVPNHLHAQMALALIDADCPVLIEKPLTGTAAEGVAVVRAGEKGGVPILVGHHRRHNPLVAKAHEIIASGALGTVTTVQGTCWLPKPDSYYAQAWRQGSGAGPLFINLIHDIDLLMYLCGPITHVQAMQSNAVRGAEAEEVTVATLRFADGALGTVNLSDVALGPWSWELTAGENPAYPKTEQSSYLIGGTAGSLSLPNLSLWTQKGGPDWWAPMDQTRVPMPLSDPLKTQIEHFATVVEGKAEPLVSGADGLRAVQVIEAIKTAAGTGNLVAVGQ